MRCVAAPFARSLLILAFAAYAAAQQDLSEQSRAASDALRAGRFPEAIALYRKLAAALPDNPGPRFNLGLALEQSGHPAEAAEQLARVVQAQPDSAPAWFLLGLAYQQLNLPKKAVEPLRKAVLLDAGNQQARLELADAELASGEPRKAVDDFGAAANAQPQLAKAWQGLGFAYASLGERAAARIDQIAPQSGYWYALLARERAGTGKPEEGLKLYGQALEALPAVSGWHAARAAILREQGHADQAGEEEKQELQLAPPDCSTHEAACAFRARDFPAALAAAEKSATPENLYWAALACGRLAEQSFQQVAALPESAEIHELSAESNQRMGRRREAVDEWRKALRLNPGDRRLQGRLADSLTRDREYDEAERLLVPLVAAQPENADWQYQLGDVLFNQQHVQAALPHLLAAERLSPDRLAVAEVLGRSYLALGQPAKAVTWLEKARPLDDGGISFALSTAYRRMGREQESRAALARYRELTAK